MISDRTGLVDGGEPGVQAPQSSRQYAKFAKRRRLWAVGLVFVALFAALLARTIVGRLREEHAAADVAATQRQALPSVPVTTVKRAVSGGSLDIPGTTMPWTEAYIYSRASGYLQKRFVDIGDHVKAGELLAVVSSPDLDQQVEQGQAGLDQAQSALAQLQAQLNLADLTWNRWKVLVAKGVFSRQEGDTQEANYRVALANVHSGESNVRAASANLRRLRVLQQFERINAPFNGVITARNVDVGALISGQGSGLGPAAVRAGGSEVAALSNSAGASGGIDSASQPLTGESQGGQLFTEAETDRLRILVSVPEGYAGFVRPGQSAALRFSGAAGPPDEGHVTRTADAIDVRTRTMLVELQVPNPRGDLKTGTYVMVSFRNAAMMAPITVPGDAIVVRNDHDAVAVIREGIVHFAPVTVGRDYGNVTEILSGLREGDTIALDVTDDVKEGARINAVPSTRKDNGPSTAQHAGSGEGRYRPESRSNNGGPGARQAIPHTPAGHRTGGAQ